MGCVVYRSHVLCGVLNGFFFIIVGWWLVGTCVCVLVFTVLGYFMPVGHRGAASSLLLFVVVLVYNFETCSINASAIGCMTCRRTSFVSSCA